MALAKNHDASRFNPVLATAGMEPTAWIFAGGDFQKNFFDAAWLAETDLIVGVDYGIVHCLAAGVVPDIVMGDFDSVGASVLADSRLAGVQRRTYPARKNSSDLELAMEWAAESGIARVVLLGVSGGRSDHHYANWMLPSQARWPFAIELIDATVHAHVVTQQHSLEVAVRLGQTISLMPMGDVLGVTTHGLEYPLLDAHLRPGSSLGLSNIACKKLIDVSLRRGRLLVLCVKADESLLF